jgi:hypothetical protein
MKNRFLIIVSLVGISLLFSFCRSNKEGTDVALAPNVHKVKAEEVIQGGMYTYARVSADGKDYWIAVNKTDMKEGNTYYWSRGGEMQEFTSKELKRTFRSIFFVEDLTDKPITNKVTPEQLQTASNISKKKPTEQPDISVPKVPGGMTIAEIYAKKSQIAGKTIKVCGQVVRVASGIMNRNWIHLQDGTKEGNDYDLTITSKDSVKVGEVVVAEGLVSVDKNIGAGYFYSILVEDAKLTKK